MFDYSGAVAQVRAALAAVAVGNSSAFIDETLGACQHLLKRPFGVAVRMTPLKIFSR
jgi:hypothetical protein